MRNRRLLVFATLALVLALGGTSFAKEAPKAQPGDTIHWLRDVPKAFEKAKAERKVLMICINSKHVDGKSREEPAAKGLREIVYKDVRVVTKSREFVCVFLTPAAGGDDYGELRHRFGMDGLIVSPQHIFAHPDHATGAPLVRLEYWSYGQEEPAVKQLLKMMNDAQVKYRAQENLPEPTEPPPATGNGEGPAENAGAPAAPDAAEARAAWIQKVLALVEGGSDARRQEALVSLVTNDRNGDCLKPLAALLPKLEVEKAQLDVIRALGRDKLFFASAAVGAFLKSKNPELRGNAAVTLEYIGNPESVDALKKRAGKEKDEAILNNVLRALGRCGKGDSKVRAVLTKRGGSFKTELQGLGGIVGLAYFEKDPKAARALEKMLKKLGPPSFGGRRGGWGNSRGTLRRAVLAWALAEVGDPKSGTFAEKELLDPLRNIKNRWTRAITDFYGAVVKACEGDTAAKEEVESGVQRTMGWAGGAEFKDAARKDRDTTNFTPKADWDVEPRSRGGGGGGRGRPPGDGN